MTLPELYGHLVAGYKIKLPEWTGYWFIPDDLRFNDINGSNIHDNIRVFTKDGEIVDTPHIDKYGGRADWEVVQE